MKKILTSLLVLFSLTVNSQSIDWDNFNSHIADSVLFVEMNKFRNGLGLPSYVYSQGMHDNISVYSTGEMVKVTNVFHPSLKDVVKKYMPSIKEEVMNTLNIDPYDPTMFSPGEVSLSHSPNGWGLTPYKTYTELAKGIIKQWCLSKPHYDIITLQATGQNRNFHYIGVGSCSVQIGYKSVRGTDFLFPTVYASFQIGRLSYPTKANR
tara:strand:- start:14 stop:637 length:624 start_codon:yes stop_codon:yes gene_type:complete